VPFVISLSIFIVTVACIFTTFSLFGNGGEHKINKQNSKKAGLKWTMRLKNEYFQAGCLFW